MSEPRVIKKYPNRRLYDTQTSTYITLADVKQLVLEHEDFQVIDAKSSDDLTRQILLQIILEEEAGGLPMFSAPMLSHIIRLYGNAMQGLLASFLEKSIETFLKQQEALQAQISKIVAHTPLATVADLTRQNLESLAKMQESMLNALLPKRDKDKGRDEDDKRS